MLRKQKKAKHASEKRESSRLSPEVIMNPVNQTAQWSHESYSLDALKAKFPMPQVVRCASLLVPGDLQNLPVNIYVPMLIYPGRTARKILAKHVGFDARSKKLVETEDSIVIPSDYDGHFLRLSSRTTQDKSAVKSLQHIAHSDIPAFVNFTPMVAFPNPHGNLVGGAGSNLGSTGSLVSGKSGRAPGPQVVSDKEILYQPGSVFVVSGVTKGFAKSKRNIHEILLLQCADEAGQEVLIPTDQSGEFVEIQVPPTGSSKLSVQPLQLMAANRYPALVRYVYGHHAPRLAPTTRMFTLVDTFEEDSLIACLLYPNHAMMIEIPMTATLTFHVATNREEVLDLGLPRHTSEIVKEKREQFMKDLKLKCKFLHQVSPGMAPADEMASATVRTRQFVNESFFYV